MHTQDTIRTLNGLIRICRDGEEFCHVGAGRAGGVELGELLRNRSSEWGRLGDELQALVLLLGGEPATSGTLAAQALRAGLILRTALFGASDTALLGELQRLTEHALTRYEEAVSGYLPERIRRTISLQADRIADRQEQMAGLRCRPPFHSQSA
jgi:uncharacterized protein (TIGR02284 family)